MIGWTKQPEVCLSSNTNSRHFKSSHLFLLMMTKMLSICVVYLTVTKPNGSENVNIMLVLIWNCHVVGFPAPNDHMMDPCFVRLWRPAGVEINNTLNNNIVFPKEIYQMSIPSCFHRHNPPKWKRKKTKKTITGPNPLTCRHWCYMTARPACQHRAPWTTTHRWTHEHLTDTNRLLFQSYACTHGRFQGEHLPHRPAETSVGEKVEKLVFFSLWE